MELVTAQSVALVAVEVANWARGGIQMENMGRPSVLPLVLLYSKPALKREDFTVSLVQRKLLSLCY